MVALRRFIAAACLWLLVVGLSGCASLLPTSETATVAPWRSCDEAMRMFNASTPSKTTTAPAPGIGLSNLPSWR